MGHGLELIHGIVRYTLCNRIITEPRKTERHTFSKKHQSRMEKKIRMNGQVTVEQHALSIMDKCAVGVKTVHDSDCRYMREYLFAATISNITI